MFDPKSAGMRIAIYARVSTEEQREGQTIDSQIAELERFARDQAWVVTGVYKDEGWSGGVMARPDLDRLRDRAHEGQFQAVLINDVDRLARDVAHLGIIKRDLEKQSVRVIFRKLPSEASPTYNLMVNVLGSFAEFERELIVDRTRRGRRYKVEVRKLYFGCKTAFGYRYVFKDRLSGKEGYLKLNPGAAGIVRRMFEWVDAEGLSSRQVLVRLNELGIRPHHAKRWGRSSVLRILHNEMYTGVWHYNKQQACEPKNPKHGSKYRRQLKTGRRNRPREEWLPVELGASLTLVTRDRWQRVQERLQRNRSFNPGHEKHFYLLKGLVRCGGCGARYVGDPCRRRFFYRCLNRCRQLPSIREDILSEAVLSATERVIRNPSVVMEQIEKLGRQDPAAEKARQTELAETEAELKRIGSEETRLLEAYRSEIITAAQLGSELEKLKIRRATTEGRRAELAAEPPPLSVPTIRKTVEEYCADAAQRFRSLPPEQLREFLRTVIRDIVFTNGEIRIQGHLPAPPSSSEPAGSHPAPDNSDDLGRIPWNLTAPVSGGGKKPSRPAASAVVKRQRADHPHLHRAAWGRSVTPHRQGRIRSKTARRSRS